MTMPIFRAFHVMWLSIPLVVASPIIAASELTSEILREAVGLWKFASGLGDPYSAEEKAEAEAAWKRMEEIGEETMSRALVVLYQQRAGVERPFSFDTSLGPPKQDEFWPRLAFRADSKEKAWITRLLLLDPRRTHEFLPLLRERVKWLIGHVPYDRNPEEVDPFEIGYAVQYLLIYGAEDDRHLVNELGAKYDQSPLPSAEKAGTINDVKSNLQWLVNHDKTRPFPFVRRVAGSAPQPASLATPVEGDQTTPPQRQPVKPVPPDSRAIELLPGQPNSVSRAWIWWLLAVCGALGGLWLLVRKSSR